MDEKTKAEVDKLIADKKLAVQSELNYIDQQISELQARRLTVVADLAAINTTSTSVKGAI